MNPKNVLYLLFIGLFLFLTACAQINPMLDRRTSCPVKDTNICQYAQVIQRGEFLRVILYKDDFFKPNSTTLNTCRFKELTCIAQMLQVTSTRCPILVTGHSDSVKSERERLRESDIMARNIAAFLWAKGVPYERMDVFGLSDSKLIASEDTPMGSAYNRRVEILAPYDDINPCP